jgi:hypothetical protein
LYLMEIHERDHSIGYRFFFQVIHDYLKRIWISSLPKRWGRKINPLC